MSSLKDSPVEDGQKDVQDVSPSSQNTQAMEEMKDSKVALDPAWLQQLCDAARRNEAPKVATLLGCPENKNRQSSALDEPLLSSFGTSADALLQQLRLIEQDSSQQSGSLGPQQANLLYKALFLAPSAYELPWKAAYDFVTIASTAIDARNRLTEIQSFLQQAVAAWWDAELHPSRGRESMASSSSPSSSSQRPSKRLRTSPTDTEVGVVEQEQQQEDISTTPRQWILRLVEAVVQPLYDFRRDDTDNWELLLPLASTLVSMSRDVGGADDNENPSLLDQCLDLVFPSKHGIRPQRIMSYLRLVQELRPWLRDKDYQSIQASLLHLFQQVPCPCLSEFLTIAPILVSLCNTGRSQAEHDLNATVGSPERDAWIASWQDVLCWLLRIAAVDSTLFASVERNLVSTFTALPTTVLKTWVRIILDRPSFDRDGSEVSTATAATATTPTWIRVNLLLVILEAARRSGSQMVSLLVAQAFGHVGTEKKDSGCNSDLTADCWTGLVSLIRNNASMNESLPSKRKRRPSSAQVVERVNEALTGVMYSGRGQFANGKVENDESQEVTWVSTCGSTVYTSLALGQPGKGSLGDAEPIMARAESWIRTADAVLQSVASGSEELLSFESLVLVLASFVTVYMEIPKCRPQVIDTVLKAFSRGSRHSETGTVDVSTSLYCCVISVLVQSVGKGSASGSYEDLDSLKDIFSRPLSLPLFSELAEALSPLPIVRSALLTIGRRNVQMTLDSYNGTSGVASRRSRDRCEHLQCGLFALCLLISSSAEWTSTESEAWLILSDALVMGRPLLPASVRTWLLLHLKELVSAGNMHRRTVEHILRACLVRLLKFFDEDQGGNVWLQPQKAIGASVCGRCNETHAVHKQMDEDLSALLELVAALVHSTVERSPKRRELRTFTASWRDRLCSFLQARGDPLNFHGFPAWPMLRSGDTQLSLHVAMYFMAKLTEHVANSEFSPKACYSTTEIASLLISQELSALQLAGFEQTPVWCEDSRHVVGASPSTPSSPSVDHGRSSALGAAICDMLAEFLIGSRWNFFGDGSESHSDDDSLKRTCQGLGALLSSRRQFLSAENTDQPLEASTISSSGAVYGVFEEYCPLALRVLEKHVVEEGSIEEASEILEGLLDISAVFDEIKGITFEDNRRALERLLTVFWDLYSSLCEEEAVVRFIAYLETKSSASDNVDNGESESDSLLSIRNADDVDFAVRHVRASVLEALRNYFSALLELSDLDFMMSGNAENGSENASNSYNTLLKFIETLSSDLRVGLNGESGGLTPEIFLLYLDCQQACARIMTKTFPSLSKEDLCQSMASFSKAAASIEEIVCSAPLQRATVFKKSMMLAACTFPSSTRLAWRHRFLEEDVSDAAATQSNFPVFAFGQCFEVLKRMINTEDSELLPWEEIAGPDHCPFFDPDGENAPDVDVRPAAKETSPSGGTKESIDGSKSLQFATEGVWQWAWVSSLLAFDNMWGESQLLQSKQHVFQSDEGARAYFLRRRGELAQIFQSVGNLFQCLPKPKSTNEKKLDIHDESDPWALTLPIAAKPRLNALLDRFFVVLQRSLKTLMAPSRDVPDGSDSSMRRLEHVEALSCVAAWLDDRNDGSEATIGVRRWYAAEKRLDALSRSKNRAFVSEAATLRQLPKLFVRIEELEWALKKACKELERSHGKAKAVRKTTAKVLQDMEPLLSKSTDQETQPDRSLSSMLVAKLHFLDEQQAKLDADLKGIADDGLVDARKRKRKEAEDIGRRVQRESRKPVVRSRNQTVDKWLYMDQLVGDDEAVDDDAYADLEDFLVDG